jgi:hypothetical protein
VPIYAAILDQTTLRYFQAATAFPCEGAEEKACLVLKRQAIIIENTIFLPGILAAWRLPLMIRKSMKSNRNEFGRKQASF